MVSFKVVVEQLDLTAEELTFDITGRCHSITRICRSFQYFSEVDTHPQATGIFGSCSNLLSTRLIFSHSTSLIYYPWKVQSKSPSRLIRQKLINPYKSIHRPLNVVHWATSIYFSLDMNHWNSTFLHFSSNHKVYLFKPLKMQKS